MMNRVLKKIVKELSEIKDIKAIILYGSFARGEVTSRSDIDLFILTTEKKTGREIEEKLFELESKTGRNIQPTIRTTKELGKTDTGLLLNIFQEGKILYLKEPQDIPSSLLLEQKPQLIYTFQISNLTQKEKVKFNNDFYGRVKGKYRYKGLLAELGGQKLSPGCVLVPYTKRDKLERLFKKSKIKFKPLRVWK